MLFEYRNVIPYLGVKVMVNYNTKKECLNIVHIVMSLHCLESLKRFCTPLGGPSVAVQKRGSEEFRTFFLFIVLEKFRYL